MDECQEQENSICSPPFRQAGLSLVRPNPICEHSNRFQPFADDDDAGPLNEPGSASGLSDPLIQEPQLTQSSEASKPSDQVGGNIEGQDEDLEPVEFEDDEPEELRRQKACEAPTDRQRREHIESNHATYRGWCDVCIRARASGTPHAVIKSDIQARKDAEKEGIEFIQIIFIWVQMRSQCLC